jgi:indolepyruvate ferredoxin oxidoreductase
MLDGLHVRGLDQTGLSQKAGRVSGDLRITTDAPAPSNLIGDEGADVIIAFDLLGAASPASLSAGDPTRTVLIGSASETPTGSMIGKPEVAYPELDELRTQVAAATLNERNRYVDAAGITEQLLGSAASANIFLLGFAYQHGVLPIAGTAIEEAIRLNGVVVEANLTAFTAGRAEAVSADTVVAHSDGPQVHVPALPGKLATRADELGADIALRAADLLAYQSAALAGRYLDLVERAAALGDASFTAAVAVSHHLLLAYKDEYEVARLLTGPEATAAITAAGGAGAKASWKLHPPILKSLGMKRKITVSTRVGVPIMKVLASGKRLRGTVLDPFGRTQMRKLERELIDIFESSIDTVVARVAEGTMTIDEATDIASLPQAVRGYEDLKIERAGIYRSKLATALG